MGGKDGIEGDPSQVSGLATWVKSDPLRRCGTQSGTTLAGEEEEALSSA